MPTLEVKENFPVCICIGSLLEGQKGRGTHPIISVDMHPQASVVGSILAKKLCMHVREGHTGLV